ncbi:MAG: hypothetical protein R3Y49_02965 [Rikenellaceae bacterium]
MKKITELNENQIFVFGSNANGITQEAQHFKLKSNSELLKVKQRGFRGRAMGLLRWMSRCIKSDLTI